nr:MAG TPA: hypothetical protein [Caudoviricetes sp.]
MASVNAFAKKGSHKSSLKIIFLIHLHRLHCTSYFGIRQRFR